MLTKKVSLTKWFVKIWKTALLNSQDIEIAVFVYIKESYVLENKCYTPNVLVGTYIIYIFLVKVTFHLQKCHKNTRTKIFVSLKQNN